MHGLLILKLIYLLCMQYSMQNEYQLLLTKLDYISIICSPPKYNATKIWFVLSIRFFKHGRPNGMNGRTIKGKYSFSACPHGYACVHTFCLRHKGETFPRGNHPTATVHLESIVFCRHKQCNWHTFTRKPRRRYERVRERERDPIALFAILRSLQLRPR